MKEEIKKKIMELLSDRKARDAIQILEYLNYPKEHDSLIMEVLKEMESEYDIYLTRHKRYLNFADSEASKNFCKGIFQGSKEGYGFVTVPNLEEDIFIPKNYKDTAMDGDLVFVNILEYSQDGKKSEGKIVKILKRDPKTKIAEVLVENNFCYALLTTNNKELKILLTGDTKVLVDGDIITIQILNEKSKNLKAKFLKRVGHKNDPGIDIIAVLAEHDFDVEFPDSVLEELKTIKTEVVGSDLKGRVDLRGEEIFTIDGDDTKDIDDAISIKKLNEEEYELGVHIADVSYYVKENSALDLEARKRGTSVYLADRVVPMLPHQLSNGICSLNPNVDRLTISCVMKINNKGKLLDYKIFPSVIKSRKQMTYNNVNKILEEGIISDDYQEFVPSLKLMQELASIIRKDKINKGYIDFLIDEVKIIVDQNGNVLDIKKRYRGVGEKLIEDFMIMANVAVASYIANANLPGIYRVHGDVNVDRLKKFLNVLQLLGISVKENLNNVNQKTIQRILNLIKDNKAFQVLAIQMLSCMDKAKYQTNNIGHFALSLRNYTHFTSPIRRYPDTTTHRLLREYFFSLDGITEEKINHFENILDDICLTSSERERASQDCEREVDDMKMAEYMTSHIGETYEGIVSGVTSFGMFVMLNDNLIEGLIRLENMSDNFIYDPNTESLTGSNTKQVYTIGSPVTIKVLASSKETRKIDFILEKDDLNEKKQKKKIKKKN